MRILLISYTSLLQKLYRQRIVEIAKFPDVEVKVLTPPYSWEKWSKKKIVLEKDCSNYEHIIGKTIFAGNLHFSVFCEKLRDLISEKPDIIDIEDEAFNLGTYQAMFYRNYYSPKSRFIFHASQTSYKHYPPPFNFIEKYIYRNADCVFARSERAKEILLKKKFSGRIENITHGVDTNFFSKKVEKKTAKEILGIDGEKIVVGYVGALEPHKGVDLLLKAISEIKSNKIFLLIIGEGREKNNLILLSRKLGIYNNINFVGFVSHDKLPCFYNSMDMFVLPSRTTKRWEEKFGRVLIEAMGCEISLIGASSGQIPDVIGDNGLIFKEDNCLDLKDKIEMLVKDKNLRKAFAEKGRKYVEENYSWKVLAKKTTRIYKKLLSEE